MDGPEVVRRPLVWENDVSGCVGMLAKMGMVAGVG